MQYENTPFSYLVEFDTGTPLGVFSYSLTDDDGNPVAGLNNIQVQPENGAVSVLIQIPSQANTLTKPLLEGRTISWFYTTSLGVVNGSHRYTIQKRVPFPVTEEGVRTKLGIDKTEMPDERVDLLGAYVTFKEAFESIDIDDYAYTGDTMTLKVTNAIEAMAALRLLPSLQISLAQRLNSGTNEYQRFAKVDWDLIRADLEQLVYDTSVLIDVNLVYGASAVFGLTVRTDPYTGA
jgi:hypothetical protein